MGRRRSVSDLRRSAEAAAFSSSSSSGQGRRRATVATSGRYSDTNARRSDCFPSDPLPHDSRWSDSRTSAGGYGSDDEDLQRSYFPAHLSSSFVAGSREGGGSMNSPRKNIECSDRTDGTTSEVREESQEKLLQIVSTLSAAELRTLQRVLSARITDEDDTLLSSSSRIPSQTVRSLPPELFEYTTLSEDTYSFMITSRLWSIPVATAVFVMIMKSSLLLLVVASMVSGEREDNPMGIPPAVTGSVIVGQFLALFVAVLTQDDLLTALKLIYEGYDREVIEMAFPNANYPKWILCVLGLFFGGLLALAVTFLLIVTSSDVVELLLNFTAIEFVSLLDNSVFFLAHRGFIGKHNKVASEVVSRTQLKIREERRISYAKQMMILFFTFLSLVAGWTAIFVQQTRGKYLANGLIVQFDDALDSELGTYSGMYKVTINGWKLGSGLRVQYTDDNKKGHFSYCPGMSVWTFYYEGTDPCSDMAACSPFTSSFDIATTSGEVWAVTSGDGRFFPSPEFRLYYGCLYDNDCGGRDRGTCENHLCVCDTGFFGYRCDYSISETCPIMTIPSDNFVFRGTSRQFSPEFKLLTTDEDEIVEVYGKAVYFAVEKPGVNLDVVLFSGLRWKMLRSKTGLPDLEDHTAAGLADFLMNPSFHASTHLGIVQFVTEPVRFNTPTDGATPADLTWYREKSGGAQKLAPRIDVPSPSRLVCGHCSKATPCSFGNICLPSGVCNCTNGATGKFCENAPVGNGHCDHPKFNTAEFKYDGGDCCKATCVSSDEHVCGTKDMGALQDVPIGFANCNDPRIPSAGCREVDNNCWFSVGDSIGPLAETGASVVKLSANGLTLALGEPLLSAVRVFDRVDSRWFQRGSIIEGSRGQEFGRTMALSTRPGSVKQRRFGKVHLHLAIGLHGASEGFRVVKWNPNDIDWSSVGESVFLCAQGECDLERIDVGATSTEVAVAARFKNETMVVYSARLTESENEVWERTYYRDRVKAFALSEQGRHVIYYVSLKEKENLILVNLSTGAQVGIDAATIDPDILGFYSLRLSFDATVITGLFSSNSTTDGVLRAQSSDFEVRPDLIVPTALPKALSRQPILSPGGNAIAIFDAVGGMNLFRPFDIDTPSLGWRPVTPKLGKDTDSERSDDMQAIELPSPHAVNLDNIAISGDGSVVALAQDFFTETIEINSLCSEEEEEVHVSIVLDENPVGVSWKLEIVRRFGTLILPYKSIRACSGCYDNNNRYGLTTIVERICVPVEDRGCLRWNFQAEDGLTEGSGYIVVSSNGEQWRPGGGSTETSVEFIGNEQNCDGNIMECGDGLALFLLAVSNSPNLHEPTWELRELESGARVGGSNREAEAQRQTGSTRIEQLCVAETGSFILKVFSDEPAPCCSGQGADAEVALYVDYQEIADVPHGRSAFVEFSQGSTSLTTESEVEVFIYMEVEDDREVSWSLEDSYGFSASYKGHATSLRLHSSTSYTLSFPNGTEGVGSFQVYMGSSRQYDHVLLIGSDDTSNRSFTVLESFVDPDEVAKLLNLTQISVDIELEVFDSSPLKLGLRDEAGSERYNTTIPANEAAKSTLSFLVRKDEHYEIVVASDSGRLCCTGSYRVYLGSELDEEKLLVSANGLLKPVTHQRFRTAAKQTVGLIPITVFMKLDRPTTYLHWEVQILAGGTHWDRYEMTHASANGSITQTLRVADEHEYRIVVQDIDQLDGFCCSYGEGFYKVYMGEEVDEGRLLAIGHGEFLYESNQRFNTTILNADAFLAPVRNASEINVTVEVSLDDEPSLVGWSIVDNRTNFVVERSTLGTYATPDVVIEKVVTLIEGQHYLLKAVDNSSDGLCCEGDSSYSRKLRVRLDDGSLLTESDGSFHVGQDGVGTKSIGFVAGYENAVPDPFFILDMYDPSSVANLTNQVDIVLVVELDRFPEEFGFYIRDVATRNVLAAAAPGTYANESRVQEVIAVEEGQRYEIGLVDSGGDGICCSFGTGSFALFWQNVSSASTLLEAYGQPSLLSRYEFLAEIPMSLLFAEMESQNGTAADVELENPVQVLLLFEPNCLPWGSGWLIRDMVSRVVVAGKQPGSYVSFLGESLREEVLLEKDREHQFAFQGSPAPEGLFCGKNNDGSILVYYGSEPNASMVLLQREMHNDTSCMATFNTTDPRPLEKSSPASEPGDSPPPSGPPNIFSRP